MIAKTFLPGLALLFPLRLVSYSTRFDMPRRHATSVHEATNSVSEFVRRNVIL